MIVQPYLLFDGSCEQAIEFYGRALGAEVEILMHYRDSPDPPPPGKVPADWGDKVMHATLRIGDGAIMAADDCTGTHAGFRGFSLSLGAADDAEAARRFAALADGGQVTMPLAKTFFASSFGMVVDRFGISWMVITAPADKGSP